MRYPATERVTLGEWAMFAAILVAFALSTAFVVGVFATIAFLVIRALRG